ncbi:methionyl-tRNA formyltransferase [Candidatus Poriferisodalis sp.]|uniref:methionyl-tRNA formyltransferase n=1 Tax=Candidatus Poriferisodalis sp. TaxID=3101277 RepID=UPI003B011FC7
MTHPLSPSRPSRVAFAGTPDDSVPALRALAGAEFEIPVVVTGTPRRRSRRGSETPSPVGAAAADLGLKVSHDPADLAGCGADCAVVVAFGQLIAAEMLAVTPMLNLHFSLLPRWRGAAPVERALLAGDSRTGVSLMALEPTLDTGPVYWQHEVTIGPADTAAGLRERLASEGATCLAASLAEGLPAPQPQEGTPTYARKLTPEDRRIDWSQPAAFIDRQIRVGGAWTTLKGQRFIIRAARPADSPPDAAHDTPPESAAVHDAASRVAVAHDAALQTCNNKKGDGHAASRVAVAHDAALRSAAARDFPPGTLAGDAVVVTPDGLIHLEIVQPAGRGAIDAQAWLRGARLPDGARFG